MSDNPRVQFRAPPELIERVERVAETNDISKSAAWRELSKRALSQMDGDFQHVADREKIDLIKEEENAKQRRAWYRHNVGSYLLKCWNGGLTPEEAADATHGYKREAQEVHEDDALIAYYDEALRVYQASYPDNGAKLSTWLKSRNPNAEPDIETDDQGAVSEDATETEPDAEHPDLTVEEVAREYVELGWDPENVDEYNARNVKGHYGQIRERMRELYDEQDSDCHEEDR